MTIEIKAKVSFDLEIFLKVIVYYIVEKYTLVIIEVPYVYVSILITP